ncbi:hypothetical protein [Saccharothrix syringae]|uniref:Uncharacterized protein n=1 Tax=Saccharothrix syringae TaxID=103733 RepID=A0A5Q0GZ02_SACSY|nr:hypothetical protein [Saccharothrix syringae]QFZ18602.1 hypothetical protein EKG83_15045 [Saccharothrix syringae]
MPVHVEGGGGVEVRPEAADEGDLVRTAEPQQAADPHSDHPVGRPDGPRAGPRPVLAHQPDDVVGLRRVLDELHRQGEQFTTRQVVPLVEHAVDRGGDPGPEQGHLGRPDPGRPQVRDQRGVAHPDAVHLERADLARRTPRDDGGVPPRRVEP